MSALLDYLRRRPLWQVYGLGLAGGLVVSVPFAWRRHPLAGWWALGIGDVVVLGQDAGGSNTDTMFTLRVKPGRTSITQIPRDRSVEVASVTWRQLGRIDQISRFSERTTRPQRSFTLSQRSSLTLVARV